MPPIQQHFAFFDLPLELRREVYRHLFWIYPRFRCRVCHAYMKPPSPEVRHAAPVFEIYIHPNPGAATIAHYTNYSPKYVPPEELLQVGIRRELVDNFLAILSVSHAVFEEAMPLFYSESFFMFTANLFDFRYFFKGSGRRRRQHFRQASVPFDVGSLIMQDYGGWQGMRLLVDALVDADRVETLEITALKQVKERYILGAVGPPEKYRAGASYNKEPYKPVVLSGLHQLLRLKFLGTLRLVGNMKALMRDFPKDIKWLEDLEKREWEGTERKTKVVIELPVDIASNTLRPVCV